jgi:hypothetical protein
VTLMRTYHCDHCDERSDEPIVVEYPIVVEEDDDGEDCGTAHLCSYACLVSWAMVEALDGESGT